MYSVYIAERIILKESMTRIFLSILFIIYISLSATTQKFHLNSNWYPNKKSALQDSIARLSKKAEETYSAVVNSSSIKSIIVPHAGYDYSGTVGVSVYRLLDKNSIEKVIILAPDHSASFEGVALPIFDNYQTPLGIINVDTEAVEHLTNNKLFHKNPDIFKREHSVEIQLPFIQTYLNRNITIIPLIVGILTCAQARAIAQVLKSFIDKNTLVIVSTDFIHYGEHFGFTFSEKMNNKEKYFSPIEPNNIVEYLIRSLDSQAVHFIEQGLCEPFAQFIKETKATICGHNPLKILLSLLELKAFGTVEPRLIAYDTSTNKEKNQSVSYVGMLFTQQKLITLPFDQQLTQQERRGLLQEAWDILANLFTKKISENLLYPIQSFGVEQFHGVFTTLYKITKEGKQLRGCIGHIRVQEPLDKTIATVTRDAALHDSRFKPVEKNELPELTLKLSIISPPHTIPSYKDIKLGQHGIILKYEKKSAVFLPEVPLEFKWDLDQTLSKLSEKAGLPSTAWRDKKTELSVFTALDITEN